ncbi:hypothetical protein EV121DRAFT_209352 [Schizophyllum commune]
MDTIRASTFDPSEPRDSTSSTSTSSTATSTGATHSHDGHSVHTHGSQQSLSSVQSQASGRTNSSSSSAHTQSSQHNHSTPSLSLPPLSLPPLSFDPSMHDSAWHTSGDSADYTPRAGQHADYPSSALYDHDYPHSAHPDFARHDFASRDQHEHTDYSLPPSAHAHIPQAYDPARDVTPAITRSVTLPESHLSASTHSQRPVRQLTREREELCPWEAFEDEAEDDEHGLGGRGPVVEDDQPHEALSQSTSAAPHASIAHPTPIPSTPSRRRDTDAPKSRPKSVLGTMGLRRVSAGGVGIGKSNSSGSSRGLAIGTGKTGLGIGKSNSSGSSKGVSLTKRGTLKSKSKSPADGEHDHHDASHGSHGKHPDGSHAKHPDHAHPGGPSAAQPSTYLALLADKGRGKALERAVVDNFQRAVADNPSPYGSTFVVERGPQGGSFVVESRLAAGEGRGGFVVQSRPTTGGSTTKGRIAAGGEGRIAAGGSRSAAGGMRVTSHANPAAFMHPSTSTLGSYMTASSSTSPGVTAPGASTLSLAPSTASSVNSPVSPTVLPVGGSRSRVRGVPSVGDLAMTASSSSSSAPTPTANSPGEGPGPSSAGGSNPASALKREEVVPWEFEGVPSESDDGFDSRTDEEGVSPPRASTSSRSGHGHGHRHGHAYTASKGSEIPRRDSEKHAHGRDHGPADLSGILRHPLDALKSRRGEHRDQRQDDARHAADTKHRPAAHSRELTPRELFSGLSFAPEPAPTYAFGQAQTPTQAHSLGSPTQTQSLGSPTQASPTLTSPTRPGVLRPQPTYAYPRPEGGYTVSELGVTGLAGQSVSTLSSRPPTVRLGNAETASRFGDQAGKVPLVDPTPVYPSFTAAKKPLSAPPVKRTTSPILRRTSPILRRTSPTTRATSPGSMASSMTPGALASTIKRIGSPVAKIVSPIARVAGDSPPLRMGGSPPSGARNSPPSGARNSPPLRVGHSPPLRVGSSPPATMRRSASPIPRRGSPLARVDAGSGEMPGAKSVPAAPTTYSPVAAPIPRSASAAPALRSSSAAPAMRTMAAMLRGSGKKGTPVPPISTQAPPSAYATSLGVHAPSIGPSTSESSTLASSLAQLSATSLSQLSSASLAQLSETLAHSESSAGHGSTSTGSVQHAQLQALHLANAPPVRSPGVHPDVQYAKALVQRRKSTGTEHRRGASGGEVLRGPNGEVLRVPGESAYSWGWGRKGSKKDADKKGKAREGDEVRREESLRSGSSHGKSQEGAPGSRRDEGLHARMWDGVAGGLVGGGGSTNVGRKPGEGMWQVGETWYGDEPVFLADGRMLMPDGSALPVDEKGRVLPPDNTPPIPSGPTRVVLPDGRVLVADVGQESDGRRVVVMPDGHVYGSGARGRVLPTDERGVLVADGAHGRMIVDIGGVPKAVAGGSSSSGRARSSEGLEALSDLDSDGGRFNTTDRTILQELRRNQSAREAEFVIKGLPQHPQKHHPYPRDQVPYPRSYEREVLDLDVWENLFCHQLTGSNTWHVFEEPSDAVDHSDEKDDANVEPSTDSTTNPKPSETSAFKTEVNADTLLKGDIRRNPIPAKVLDIGCGTGTWVLNCASLWKDTHFVGLDVVPLHPSAPAELAGRVTWVQANFLEGLPFPNEEFDYVHVKRIALGVPEDRWDALFEEITRVMKPGAPFEMVEEDLFFPGMQPEEESSAESDKDDVLVEEDAQSANDGDEDARSSIESITFADTPEGDADNADDKRPSHGIGESTPEDEGDTPAKKEKTPDVDASQDVLHLLDTALSPVVEQDMQRAAEGSVPAAVGRSRSPTTESQPRPSLTESMSSQVTAVPLPSPTQPRHYQQPASVGGRGVSHRARTLTNSSIPMSAGSGSRFVEGGMASLAEVVDDFGAQAPGGLTAEGVELGAVLDTRYDPRARSGRSFDLARGGRARSVDLHQRVSMETTTLSEDIPPNPRDHSVLEHIYTEMHASRFVNLAPLSLLANTLRLHFEDVRSHPPLEFSFPPRPPPPAEDNSSDDSLSDSDDEGPSSRHTRGSRSSQPEPQMEESNRILTTQNIVRHDSQLVTFDESRFTSFSGPQRQNIFRFHEGLSNSRQRLGRVPSLNMHLDVRCLNLHLALRAAEIRACAEPMWEWVQEYQAKRRALQRSRSRASLAALSDMGQRGPEDEVAMLAREDFDELLARFEMDMRDRCGLGYALESRFGWPAAASAPSPERKAFDMACERYEKWRAQQDKREEAARRARASVTSRRGSMSPVLQRSGSARSASRDVGKISGTSREPRSSGASSAFGDRRQKRQVSRALCVFVGWKAEDKR